jgi:hypothetical protein
VIDQLRYFHDLETLRRLDTGIEDAFIKRIDEFLRLRVLGLFNASITDAGQSKMSELKTKFSVFLEGTLLWPVVAALFCTLYTVIFTVVLTYILTGDFIVDLGWKVSELHGYILFVVIFIPTLIYEICFAVFSHNKAYSDLTRLAITVGAPCFIISLLVIGIGFPNPISRI